MKSFNWFIYSTYFATNTQNNFLSLLDLPQDWTGQV